MADTREIWVDIKNYEGKYRISNLGRVKSLERQVSHDGITWIQPERIMCHWCGTTSLYDCVRLYKGGVGKKFSVHRLVAQHFLPDWNPGLEVNHIDGNRDNNRADNLEMCTHQRNMEHAIAGGLKRDYGEKSVNAKLTNGQAEEIRVRYSSGQASQNSLAKQYGVSRQTVSAIIRYKKYIHHYEGIYQVSSCGRIRSVGRYVRNATSQYWRNGQIIKPWVGGTSPYYNVSLASDGKICKKLIHRLVAEHFLDDWNAAKEVNHKDGNKHNNRSDNLEMCTRQENVMHSMVHKLRDDYGENSVNAKLTNEQADHIRRLHRSGVMQNELAEQFKVCKQTICDIVHYKKYKK